MNASSRKNGELDGRMVVLWKQSSEESARTASTGMTTTTPGNKLYRHLFHNVLTSQTSERERERES